MGARFGKYRVEVNARGVAADFQQLGNLCQIQPMVEQRGHLRFGAR